MIFNIQATNEDAVVMERIITSLPPRAWEKLEALLRDEDVSFISLQYWYNDGRLRSNYAIDKRRNAAWLFDGESTPTILKGIQHYMKASSTNVPLKHDEQRL